MLRCSASLSSTANLSLATVRLEVAVHIAQLDCAVVVLSVLRLCRVCAGLVYLRLSRFDSRIKIGGDMVCQRIYLRHWYFRGDVGRFDITGIRHPMVTHDVFLLVLYIDIHRCSHAHVHTQAHTSAQA